jgi:hypothetical protein
VDLSLYVRAGVFGTPSCDVDGRCIDVLHGELDPPAGWCSRRGREAGKVMELRERLSKVNAEQIAKTKGE